MGKTKKKSARHTVRSKKPINRAKLSHTKKVRHTLRAYNIDISIFKKLNRKCKNVSEFADFLLETGNRELYDTLVTYINTVNANLEKTLHTYKSMYIHTYTRYKTNDMDTFETLVSLSSRVTKFGRILLKQSKKQRMFIPILEGLIDSVQPIYRQLKDALESFEGELELAAQIEGEEAERQRQAAAMNEESGTNNNNNNRKNTRKNNNNNNNNGRASNENDDSLGDILEKFRSLGLSK